MRRLTLFLIAIYSLSFILVAQDVSENNILELVDEKLNFQSDFSCQFTMVTYRAGAEPSTQKMSLFSRPEEIDGEEKFLAIVMKPDIDKGTGYLGQGDNYWIYDPESRRFSHSSARDTVQDSDVNNDDLGTADFNTDYKVVQMTEGMLGQIDCWILDLVAISDNVDYQSIKLWVGKKELLPYKEQDFSLTGTLMRTVLAPKWTVIEGKYIYRQVFFVDEIKRGNRTILLFDNVSLNTLPDHLFTKAYLEGSSR
ncbi:MAG: outer membrane lipoprotein-sorting protein [Spirochaetaceae bacterium]|nr:outer membrane lipoprotein-sorting protein [Spirochaetaceae bacterium]